MELSLDQINNLIAEIESQENIDRKKQEYDSHKIYSGELRYYVRDRLEQIFPKSFGAYHFMAYSVLKKIVDKKSKSYKVSPLRKLDSTQETEAYQSVLTEGKFNFHMRKFDRFYNQHRYALMGIFKEGDKYKFIPSAPYEFDVVLDNEGKLKIVVLSMPDEIVTGGFVSDAQNQKIAEPTSDDEGDKKTYTIWTDTNHYLVTTSTQGVGKEKKRTVTIEQIPNNPGNVNPYGVLNFVYMPFDFSNNYPIASDLPYKTIEFNALYSIYQTSGTMQVGVLVMRYPSDQQIDVVTQGIFTGMKLPQSKNPEDPETDAKYISPSPNMSGHKEAVITNLMTILDEEGLETSHIVTPGQNFASGFDRAIAMADVQDVIEENQDGYSMLEQDAYDIIKAIESKTGGFSYKSKKIKVVYQKPKILTSDSEKITNIKSMNELGVLESHEKLMLVDPNLSEQDAKDKLKRINASKMQIADMMLPKEEAEELTDDV